MVGCQIAICDAGLIRSLLQTFCTNLGFAKQTIIAQSTKEKHGLPEIFTTLVNTTKKHNIPNQ